MLRIKKKKFSRHYRNERYKRESLIKKHLNGDGNIVDTFIVDNGKGVERHEITNNGIILIYNNRTNMIVTKLIARESQLKRYYKDSGKQPPVWLLELCRWHQSLNYNK